MSRPLLLLSLALLTLASRAEAQAARGVIPRAKKPVIMDGRLDEWSNAFATPVNFGHSDWAERAAVWRCQWDEANLYVALECLDTTPFNKAPGPIYDGDGVEFYLDVREPGELGKPEWGPGTVHLFFTGFSNGEVRPRVQVRGGIAGFKDVKAEGMECAASRTTGTYTVEFRLPWSKFPGFKPQDGREIGIDLELCSSDGGPRVDRCWVYSGVAAVGGPAAFGRVKLVDNWDPASGAYSEVLLPSFLARSTPLGEPATLFLGVSPDIAPLVKRVELLADGNRKLPFVAVKKFGPGWSRIQACLVGFTTPKDESLAVRLYGEGDQVLGTRTISLK